MWFSHAYLFIFTLFHFSVAVCLYFLKFLFTWFVKPKIPMTWTFFLAVIHSHCPLILLCWFPPFDSSLLLPSCSTMTKSLLLPLLFQPALPFLFPVFAPPTPCINHHRSTLPLGFVFLYSFPSLLPSPLGFDFFHPPLVHFFFYHPVWCP